MSTAILLLGMLALAVDVLRTRARLRAALRQADWQRVLRAAASGGRVAATRRNGTRSVDQITARLNRERRTLISR